MRRRRRASPQEPPLRCRGRAIAWTERGPMPPAEAPQPPRAPTEPGNTPLPRPSWKMGLPLAILLGGFYVFDSFTSHRAEAQPTIPYSAFYHLVETDKVESLTLRG